MATGDNPCTVKSNPVTQLALNTGGKHLVVEFTRRLTVVLHNNPSQASRKRIGDVLGETEPMIDGPWHVFRVGVHAH